MPGLGVQPNLLSAAKLPPRLLERMNELREDEGARGDLERRVESGRRATRRRAEMAHSSAKASKRQQLMQQLFTAHAPPAPPPPPRHDAGTHDDPPGSPQRRPPVAGRRSIQRRGSIEYASMIGLDEHGIARPDVEQAERETPAPPPPLPPKQAMPWAHDAVERARGDRTRDPLECGDSAQSVVRRREKGLELGGVFRYAVQSDTQRLAALAETIEPLDQPAPNLGAALAGLPVTRPGAAAALWKGGDFLNTRPSASPIADAVMLHGHRCAARPSPFSLSSHRPLPNAPPSHSP